MRYQSPVTSPLAHYWEEELGGVWAGWIRFINKTKRVLRSVAVYLFFVDIFSSVDMSGSAVAVNIGRQRSASKTKNQFVVTFGKRAIDIFGSGVGLVLSAPLWIIIAILIKIDSRGPVLYSQIRVGKNRRKNRDTAVSVVSHAHGSAERRSETGFGKPFKILKFRTMFQDAEKNSGPVWAQKRDPRVTRVGRMLRKTRLDEIPQLLNVLAGDMSLVGPRPERPFFVKKLDTVIDNYIRRFDVKPGVTGLAQIEHKYDESIADVDGKIKYDLKYIRNLSVVQDIKILLKTVLVVLSARGM